MAKVVTDDKHYHDIGDAIRAKNGEATQYKPSEMAAAIGAISGGGADFSEVESKLSNGFTDYSYYFYNRTTMTEVPTEILQHTANGTIFSYMFASSTNLTAVPLFNTSNGTDFRNMFYSCQKLASVPQLNTSNGTNFYYMFSGCSKLASVPLFNTSSGTNFASMFNGCLALTSAPQLDTSSGTGFTSMFNGCSSLASVPQLNTSSGTEFNYMFSSCRKLTTIGGVDFSNSSKTLAGIFNSCSALENLTINGIIKQTGLDLSPCSKLTHTSLMSIINALYDWKANGGTSTYKLTLGNSNLAKLTDAEKAIATEKGWTLA